MSTVPGDDTWADAGLVRPDEATPLDAPADTPDGAEPEHVPAAPRPDLDGGAGEPDVVEQAVTVGDDDEDDYPEG